MAYNFWLDKHILNVFIKEINFFFTSVSFLACAIPHLVNIIISEIPFKFRFNIKISRKNILLVKSSFFNLRLSRLNFRSCPFRVLAASGRFPAIARIWNKYSCGKWHARFCVHYSLIKSFENNLWFTKFMHMLRSYILSLLYICICNK